MNEEENLDEVLADFLWECYLLKKKATEARYKNLPAWLINLLDKPSLN